MAFTLNRKNGEPYYGDKDGTDNQLNKEEAADVGIDNDTFEQNDTNNTGKLDKEETANAFVDKASESEEERLLGDANSFTDNQPTTRNVTEPLFNTQKPANQVRTKVDPSNPDSVSLGEEERLLGFEYTLKQLKEEEEKRKRDINLPRFGDTSAPVSPVKGSSLSSTPLPTDKSSLQWDTTKQTLDHALHGLKALDPLTSISHSSSSKLPSISDKEVVGKGGHILDTPETGTPTSTSGTVPKAPGITPTGKVGNASAFFKGVISGQYRHKGMPSTGSIKKTPTNAVKKLNLTSAKENIFERCVQLIQRNYKNWPSKDGEKVFEKGLIAIYVKGKDEIKIKYGSYREVLFETFAKAHPELLKNIYSVLS